MFDNLLVASTAISSFNNAALLNPFFFAVAVLLLPLFVMVYLYGRDFVSRFGWNNQNAESKTAFWSAAVLGLFIILFGGNYAVIRGGISLLPLVLAVILFLLMIIVSNNFVRLKYIEKIHDRKSKWLVFIALLLGVAFSGLMTWWGILLQLSAVICGTIIGCRLRKDISWVGLITLVYGMMIVAVLMQPEFFRFGQLGHLTLIHLIGLVLGGFFVVTTFVSKYVKARNKMRQSVFVKLKWLFRIVSILALILFISTESVPVFLGLLISLACLETLNIYHAKKIQDILYKQSWAVMMIVCGILIVCPVISALGIVYLSFLSNKVKLNDFTGLL